MNKVMTELKAKSSSDLMKMLNESKKALLNLRFSKRQGQLDDSSQFKKIRKTIAQVKTMLYQHNNAKD